MNNVRFILPFLIFVCCSSRGDTITVNNKTYQAVWAAVYHDPIIGSLSQRQSAAVKIMPLSSAVIAIPTVSMTKTRQLAVSEKADVLKQTMELNIPHVGIAFFSNFYVLHNRTELTVVNPLQLWWTSLFNGGIRGVAREAAVAYLTPYKRPFPRENNIARVREGNDISAEERSFRTKRLQHVRPGLSRLLGRDVTEPRLPTIGICVGGEGYRAMLSCMAFLQAAQKMELLEASSYISALSGSAWALTSWMVSQKSVSVWLSELITATVRGPSFLKVSDWREIQNVLFTKMAYEEPITVVDLWGADLARRIFFEWLNP